VPSGGCWESGGPAWLFGLVLAGATGALFTALPWFVLRGARGEEFTPVSAERRRRRRRRPTLAQMLVPVGCVLLALRWRDWQDRTGVDVAILGVTFALTILAFVPILVAGRRARRDGVWPPAREAALGAYWLLPVVFVVCVTAAVGAAIEMVRLGHPC
jgi:hypothetical protein